MSPLTPETCDKTPRVSRYGLLGGGFALYGWLPAIARLTDQPIPTLARYESTLNTRPELRPYLERVRFVSTAEEVLSACDVLVCAKRPIDQVRLVESSLAGGWGGHFVLEKPLAPDPPAATALLEAIEKRGNGLAVGFSMRPTSWAKQLRESISQGAIDRFEIDWRFLAHHYAHDLANWKRQPICGGGALRFYAIHLVAVLAEVGPWEITSVTPASDPFEDPYVGVRLRQGELQGGFVCDSRHAGEPFFRVTLRRRQQQVEELFAEDPLAPPFRSRTRASGSLSAVDPEGPDAPREDRRIGHLVDLLKEANQRNWSIDPCVRGHLQLWRQVECQRRG